LVSPLSGFLLACMFAPYVETQGMRLLFFALRKCAVSADRLKWYVAAVFGVLHVDSETWGLHAVWGFYIMSTLYLDQQRISTRRAVWMTVSVHSLCNLFSYVSTLIERAAA
jgi:hypothetical protein